MNMHNINVTCVDCSLPGANFSDFPAYVISKGLTVLLAGVMFFTTLMDIFGNMLLILSVLQNKKLQNAGNMFVISLSAADIIVAVYPYPLLIGAILQNQWTFGNIHCQISSLIHSLSFIGSVYNIMAIAINRWCCICHSIRYDNLYSMRNTYIHIFLTWAVSFILLLFMFLVGVSKYNPQIYSCMIIFAATVSLNISVPIIHFIIPVSVVIYCYVQIWILVIQVKYRVRQDSKQKLKPAEVRNFLTMFLVFVLFAVCWSPFSIPALIQGFSPPGKAPKFPDWLFVVGYFTACFNSCLNGMVYGVFNQNFRQEYKKILWSLCTFILRGIHMFSK
ncbi:melatonin receptor type 1C-like [Protopterus annectens]|uniref:melatonin receptor type 1C-like n=1 Tax=Protopterus annectens TaxID=7888 RepID=UPI001CFAAF11|nr:melatonin receptor type 1C-like [Protopterus annectens]